MIVRVDRRYLAETDPSSSAVATAAASSDQRVSFGAKYAASSVGGAGGVSAGYVLREESASAGFKKKKGVLTVKIQYS